MKIWLHCHESSEYLEEVVNDVLKIMEEAGDTIVDIKMSTSDRMVAVCILYKPKPELGVAL